MTLVVAVILGALTLGAAQVSYSSDAGPLDDASLTFLGVRVGGSNTLSEVAARMGATVVWGTGDAATSESQICYRVPTTGRRVIIVFASNNEMSQPKGQVNHIVVYGDPRAFPDRERCAMLNRPPGALSTLNGLRLGLSPSEARRILGPRQLRKDQSLLYEASQRRYLEPTDSRYSHWAVQKQCFDDPSRPYFDDFASITIKFRAGAAILLGLSSNQSWC